MPDAYPDADQENHDVLRDRAKREVEIKGEIWTIRDPKGFKILDWSKLQVHTSIILEVFKEYIKHRINNNAPATAAGEFDALRIATRTTAFSNADRLCSTSDTAYLKADIFSEMVGNGINRTRCQRWRRFYRWACEEYDLCGYPAPHFSHGVAEEMGLVAIGANRQIEAALELDENFGPLLDAELHELINALSQRNIDTILDLQQQVAIWLNLGLGTNSGHLALLRVEHFKIVSSSYGPELYTIAIPRLKKPHIERDLTHFKIRRLNYKIGELVGRLVEQRLADPRLDAWVERNWGIPIFLRPEPDKILVGTPTEDYCLHMRSGEFSSYLSGAVAKLGVVSPRTGRGLHINPRRLRHTFATNAAVREVPRAVIAEGLDHSSDSTVRFYVDNSRMLAERIDRALDAMARGLVRAFRGRVAGTEGEVIAVHPHAERIYAFDESVGEAKAVGSCASCEACTLQPPLSCYTCIDFHPWMAADHRAVLASLETDRDARRAAGLSERVVRLHDRTIDAVNDVIREADRRSDEGRAADGKSVLPVMSKAVPAQDVRGTAA